MGCASSRPPPPRVASTKLVDSTPPSMKASGPLAPLPAVASIPPEVADAAAALVSSGGPSAARLAARLLHIAAVRPSDPRAARVRLSHPRVHAAIVLPVGGLELFEACGYRCAFGVWPPGAKATAAAEAWLVLDEGAADVERLAAGATVLRELAAAAAPQKGGPRSVGGTSGDETDARRTSEDVPLSLSPVQQLLLRPRSPSRPPSPLLLGPPRALTPMTGSRRRARVLLPTSAAADLPDDVAALLPLDTAAAVAAAAAAELRASEAARSVRKAASAASATASIHITAHPEGMVLDVKFRGDEPVGELVAWVEAQLTPEAAAAGFTLATRDGTPLPAVGTLDDAHLGAGGELTLRVNTPRSLADAVVARAVPAPRVCS